MKEKPDDQPTIPDEYADQVAAMVDTNSGKVLDGPYRLKKRVPKRER